MNHRLKIKKEKTLNQKNRFDLPISYPENTLTYNINTKVQRVEGPSQHLAGSPLTFSFTRIVPIEVCLAWLCVFGLVKKAILSHTRLIFAYLTSKSGADYFISRNHSHALITVLAAVIMKKPTWFSK